MEYFATILIIALTAYSALSLLKRLRLEPMSALTFWHGFLLALLYPRLIFILYAGSEFRWLAGAESLGLAKAVTLVAVMSGLATVSVEFGWRLGRAGSLHRRSRVRYSCSLSILVLSVGVIAFLAYFSILGGLSSVAGGLAESKSVRGGGVLLMFTSLSWLAPAMVVFSKSNEENSRFLILSWVFLGCSVAVAMLYGRATPIVWGVLLLIATRHFNGVGLGGSRAVTLGFIAIGGFLAFKAMRLAASWGRDLGTLFEYVGLYLEFVLSNGGEQAVTDMSVRLMLWGGEEFPLGSFWNRWLMWPLEVTPRFLFPFEIESITVGRRMYWWATSNTSVDAGVPIFGFVSAFKTGSYGLIVLVYTFFGFICSRTYRKAQSEGLSSIVVYIMSLSLFLFFSRLGDFSAAAVQVVVLGLIPYLALLLLDGVAIRYRGEYPGVDRGAVT